MAVRVVPAMLSAPARPHEGVLARIGVAPWLALIVAAGAALRLVFGLLRATPVYLPDEYMYSELARSIAETGRPLIRGAEAHFPALLQPVLTAPLWLVADVGVAYRLVQVVGALVMALAAPLAYVLARRAGVSPRLSLGVALVAVAVPDFLYATWILAEPFAYPLVIAACAAAVAALTKPTRKSQLTFVGLAVLAMFARAQFVVLAPCFVVATVVVGLRERALRATLRAQVLPLTLFAIPLAAMFARGPKAVLGIYTIPSDATPVKLLERAGPDSLILLYAAGWVIVPGALLGLWLALRKPRSRAELAFGAMTLALAPALLAETAIFGAVDSVQERYVFYIAPLLAVGFALYAQRGWPLRRAHAGIVIGLFLLSVRFPLSGWSAVDGKEHSPVLLAEARLEELAGTPGSGAGIVAAVALLLCGVAMLGSFRPRFGTVAAFALAAVCGLGLYVAAATYDRGNSGRVAQAFLSDNRNWVDDSGVEHVAVLRSRGSLKIDALQLFWNRNVDNVLLLPGASVLDSFQNDRVAIGRDGALSVGGKAVRSSLLVDDYGVTVKLSGARKVASSPIHTLWRAEGTPRLAMYVVGRYNDGWLATDGGVNLWPANGERSLAGWFTLNLSAPSAESGLVKVRFALPDGTRREYKIRPGDPQSVRLAVCARGPWQASFASNVHGFLAGRSVSAKATEPQFVADPAACAGNQV